MHYCRRDSHTTSRTAIYANITQTGRIWVYCSWFWVVLVGFVGFVGGFGWFCWWFWVVLGRFGWFWVVPCFSNYAQFHWVHDSDKSFDRNYYDNKNRSWCGHLI